MDVPESTYFNRKRKWASWSGSVRDLHGIIDVLDEAIDSFRTLLEASRSSELDRELAQSSLQTTRPLAVTATVDYLPDEDSNSDMVRGAARSILETVDIRETFDIEFDSQISVIPARVSSGLFSEAIVRLRRGGPQAGIEIEVRSNHQRKWAHEVYRSLEQECRLGVPRWAWLHGAWGRLAFAASHGLAGALIIYPIVLLTGAQWWLAALAGLTILGALTLGASTRGWRSFVLPHFEIVETGAEPRGTRRLVTAGTLVAGAVLGLVASIWLAV